MQPRAIAALAVVVLLAGCTGGALSFAASPATVDEAALDEANYTGQAPEQVTINETVEVAGMSKQVSATTWTASYAANDTPATLVVASTPDATVAGQSVNPIARLTGKELLQRVAQEIGNRDQVDLEDVEVVQRENREILGTQTEVTTFATTASTEQGDVPIRIHLASVSHQGDAVVLVGVHPEEVDERSTQLTLMESVDHQGDEE
ncbi:DUF6517 family protein [Haloparvum sp. PAK95]|uniref:DUF6517 family protein n=1 Tax=Haloparvum sp. PAK95 TaxID=3418962 RepID=UPI003D2F4219